MAPSITLLEPHMHGDVHIGPKTVTGEEDEDPSTGRSGPNPIVMVIVSLVGVALAIALTKKLVGPGDED